MIPASLTPASCSWRWQYFVLARRCFPTPGGWRCCHSAIGSSSAYLPLSAEVLGAKLPFVFQRGADWFGSACSPTARRSRRIDRRLHWRGIGQVSARRAREDRDAFALPLRFSLAVGAGLFLHGCCYGVGTNCLGVDVGDGRLRHPTQIYESLFHLTCLRAIIIIRHGWLRNQRLKFYLIAYGVYRFLTEFIRPEEVYAFGLTYFQYVAMFIVVGGLTVVV